MLNETVIFRATDELAEAIQHCASEAQLTVSEYLRSIISDCVGVREVNIRNAASSLLRLPIPSTLAPCGVMSLSMTVIVAMS